MAERFARLVRLVAAALAVALAVAGPATADAFRTVARDWYVLSLGGEPCGHSLATREESEEDGGLVRTRSEASIRLGRGTTTVTVSTAREFVETAAGRPLRASVRQSLGGDGRPGVEIRYEFRPGEVEVTEGERRRVEPSPEGDWLAPAAAERFVRARLAADAAEISFRTIDLESGLRVASLRLVRGDPGRMVVRGKDIPVVTYRVRNDLLDLPGEDRYDAEGTLVSSVLRLGIGELVSTLADETEARAALRNARAEVLVRSFVPAPEPIRNARGRRTLRLEVAALAGDLPDLPSVGAQRARRIDATTVEVEVDARRGSPASPEEIADRAFLAATALIDHDTPEVRELVARTRARGDRPPRRLAEALRVAVRAALPRKDLASAFASASDALRSGGGDCSEHAVALAAALRAVGIPARIVGGLVYADSFAGEREVWGWHVWTQALVPARAGEPPEWIDLDATLPGERAFDAAHVATGASSLAGGALDPLWSDTLALLGNLKIRVVDPAGDADGARPDAAPAGAVP